MSEAAVFPLRRVECRHRQVEWPFVREHAGRIAAFWAEFCARNPASFNGRVFLLHEARFAPDGGFAGACLEADFSAFIAWRDFGYPGGWLRNFFAMAALRAADGAFLLGEMAPGTANAGKIYFPCGTPDPADRLADGTIDLAASALRELGEETGLKAAELRVLPGWLCVDSAPCLAFLREVRLDLPAREARAMLLARINALPERELVDIHIVRGREDIDPQRMPAVQLAFLRHAFARG